MSETAATPLLNVDSDGVAWITFSDPDRSVNVLNEAVMARLSDQVREVGERGLSREIRAVVIISGKPDSFMAGADLAAIESIQGPDDGEEKSRLGQAVFRSIEGLPVPTIAAVHGICLGGGLEMALACRHRILSSDPATRLGLPEVQLGLLPGWGGTTRLPRLIGLQASLDMMLTGKQVRASSARRSGLADAVVPAEGFRDAVRRFALQAAEGELPGRPRPGLGRRILSGTGLGRAVVIRAARKQVMARTGGHYPAPLRILDVVREGMGLPLDQAFALEARVFGELSATPVHRNLLHVFHLREDGRKLERILPDVRGVQVDRMGVVGAGVMGGGIAQLAARKEVEVRLKDIRDEAVLGGLQHARSLFDKAVERRRMTRREAEVALGRISGGLDYAGFSGADLVVEAVVERMDVKRSVLAEVEEVVPEGCVIATNTSSLSVDAMAAALKRPERFCGMHFFNPVHKMPLVEIVRGERTSDEAVATVHRLAVRLGKVPVVCLDGPGFLVNRILVPYLNEAGYLVSEGVGIETVDRVATGFGMPMGPIRLLDEVGLDVARHAGGSLHEALGERLAPPPLLDQLDDPERLGRKTGLGFYRYEGGKEKGVDAGVYAAAGLATPSADGADTDEIRRRLVLTMINEAARILEEGVVGRAAAVDLGMIMGTGFPPFRGGLLRFADAQHPRSLVEHLRRLEDRYGPRFAPAPVLAELAREDRYFYQAFP